MDFPIQCFIDEEQAQAWVLIISTLKVCVARKDRPPIVGTQGCERGLLRLRLVRQTDAATLSAHVHKWTLPTATVYQESLMQVP